MFTCSTNNSKVFIPWVKKMKTANDPKIIFNMTSIATNLQTLITSLQNEMDATNTQFKLMLELRTVVVAEYEAMARQYISLKNEIQQDTEYMGLLLASIKSERAELDEARAQLQNLKHKPKTKPLSSKPRWV